MSMNLSDFSLLKEDAEHYTIGHPKGKSMMVPKKGISDKAQKLISKLKREQNFADGTPEGTEVAMASPSASDEQAAQPLQVEAIPPGGDQAQPQEPMLPMPVEAPPMETAGPPTEQQAQASPPPAPENPLTRGAAGMNKEFQVAQQIATEDAAAKAATGIVEAKALGSYINQAQQQQAGLNDRMAEYKQKDDAFQQKLMNQEIDPNRYMNSLEWIKSISQSIAISKPK